jgi:hypothetical protein
MAGVRIIIDRSTNRFMARISILLAGEVASAVPCFFVVVRYRIMAVTSPFVRDGTSALKIARFTPTGRVKMTAVHEKDDSRTISIDSCGIGSA